MGLNAGTPTKITPQAVSSQRVSNDWRYGAGQVRFGLHLRELCELYQLSPVLYETSSNTFQYDIPAEDNVKKIGGQGLVLYRRLSPEVISSNSNATLEVVTALC